MGERLLCTQEAVGSSPSTSTWIKPRFEQFGAWLSFCHFADVKADDPLVVIETDSIRDPRRPWTPRLSTFNGPCRFPAPVCKAVSKPPRQSDSLSRFVLGKFTQTLEHS